MEILGKLFGSPARIKIMRLFLLNGGIGFENQDVVRKAKVNKNVAKKELSLLSSTRFIKPKTFVKDILISSYAKASKGKKDILKDTATLKLRSAGRVKRTKVKGWFLNPSFPQIEIFKVLLIGTDMMSNEEIGNRFKKAGRIKLLAVAGIFLQDRNSRVDLLIVGDSLKRGIVDAVIKDIEAEIGKELVYALFETKEFMYRLNMYDKLIDDVLSYPHKRIIESREFSTLPLKKS